MPTRTMLFLGVSFTDAYLNELRSEVLSLLLPSSGAGNPPLLGYAIMPDMDEPTAEYFRRHEGIHVLHYSVVRDAAGNDSHAGFDEWLARIHAKTAPKARLGALLERNPSIVWLDAAPENNDRGLELIRSATGRDVAAFLASSPLVGKQPSVRNTKSVLFHIVVF